jgi:glycosyltransferase involved in cell wall biosynthesis
MKMPTVAVVTRTKNRPLMLERAAKSVERQVFSDFVWIVVNDGGDEGDVRAVLARFPALADRTTLVSKPVSGGMEAASNAGIGASESELIVIHDDDDSWEPRFLEECVGFLQSPHGKRFGGVVTYAQYVSEEIVQDCIVERGRWLYRSAFESVDLGEMIKGNVFPPISFVFRREVYSKIGGFNESLPVLGDWAFNLEFLMQEDIGVLPKMLANYHHRDQAGAQVGIYANSVIGGASVHGRYAGVVRNGFLRKNAAQSAAPLVAILGAIVGEQQAQLARYEAMNWGVRQPSMTIKAGFSVHSHQDFLDLCWVLLHANSFLQQNRLRLMFLRGVLVAPLKPDADWPAVLQRVRKLRMLVPDPPNFDAQAYLDKYKDVAAAVNQGKLRSAYMHYIFCGRSEDRNRPIR